jgi:hypothetical protein
VLLSNISVLSSIESLGNFETVCISLYRVFQISLSARLLGPGSLMQFIALNLIPRSLTGTFFDTPCINNQNLFILSKLTSPKVAKQGCLKIEGGYSYCLQCSSV